MSSTDAGSDHLQSDLLPSSQHPYDALTHERVMDAIEQLGWVCDARIFPLNSYENRVYQVGIEDDLPIIAKFYRPDRWSAEAIQEEHDFLLELKANELPVVAPITVNGRTLFEDAPFYFALFPRRGGQAPELANPDDLELLGRWLGRLHSIGERQTFQHRPSMAGAPDLAQAAQQVLNSSLMPMHYADEYQTLMAQLQTGISERFVADELSTLRLHGDLHVGNLLLREQILYMVDFDDSLNGPAMQDIWMLLSGEDHEQRLQLSYIREGYEMFRPFPVRELPLIDSLRTMRICRHAGWLCQRWQDPAFPNAFPWVAKDHYWMQHIGALRECIGALDKEALVLL